MTTIECPKCKTLFAPKRANMKYCKEACAKNATRKDRSREIERRSEAHYDRAAALLEYIDARHSQEHPKIAADLLRRAVAGDGALRNILTDPKLLRSPCKSQNIAQKVNEFCRRGAKRSSCQIIKEADLLSVEKIERMSWQPYRCPKPRPESWDFRLQLPAHLRGESLQSSSAYNNRPDALPEIEHAKCSVLIETQNVCLTADDEEDVDGEMTFLSALAA